MITDTSEKKEVKVVLIGQTVPDEMIANAKAKMPKYGLKNVHLIVQQGFGQEATDINELKSLLMQDLYKNSEEVLRVQTIQIDSLKRQVDKYQSYGRLTSELIPEMKVLFPLCGRGFLLAYLYREYGDGETGYGHAGLSEE